MAIATIGVVGCGQMGGGIVRSAAAAGYTVRVSDATPETLTQGLGRMKAQLARDVEKGRVSADDRDGLLARITPGDNLSIFSDCDLVIEAVVENMAEKKRIFAALDTIVEPETILASNTSSLSITEIATATQRPEKVAGCHFFNPVPLMPIIELVRGLQTSDETITALQGVGERMGKTTVIAKDSPGFIVNFLLIPYLLDAIRALENGLATREDIDNAMKLGCNLPMGPLTLCDFIGNDTILFIADAMYEELRDPRFAAPPLLRRMVLAKQVGRKGGRGFYAY